MLISIHHETCFRYPVPAIDSHNEIRLQPVTDDHQSLAQFALTVNPSADLFAYATPWGVVHNFDILEPHTELRVIAESTVETRNGNPFDRLNLVASDWGFYTDGEARSLFAEYLTPTRLAAFEPEVAEFARDVQPSSADSAADFLIELTERLYDSLEYDPDATHVGSTLREVLDNMRGVCQDYAHLMLAVCRSQGIPARYVSGYVVSRSDHHLHGDEAMHAWVECALPDGRWQGFDPTNNLLANEQYVKVHVGRDYSDASPIRGVYHGLTADELAIRVTVRSLNGMHQQQQTQNQ